MTTQRPKPPIAQPGYRIDDESGRASPQDAIDRTVGESGFWRIVGASFTGGARPWLAPIFVASVLAILMFFATAKML